MSRSSVTVATHHTISIDGAVTGFPVDIGLHYAHAPEADAKVVGSRTARLGIEQFMGEVPEETDEQRMAPPADAPGPRWVIPDSTGRLQGLLHVLRGSTYCTDVLVLASSQTPRTYLDYLAARGYRHHVAATKHVDLADGVHWAARETGATVFLADGGPGLFAAIWAADLVQRMSLIIAPRIADDTGLRLFRAGAAPRAMRPNLVQELDDGHVQILYDVGPT